MPALSRNAGRSPPDHPPTTIGTTNAPSSPLVSIETAVVRTIGATISEIYENNGPMTSYTAKPLTTRRLVSRSTTHGRSIASSGDRPSGVNRFVITPPLVGKERLSGAGLCSSFAVASREADGVSLSGAGIVLVFPIGAGPWRPRWPSSRFGCTRLPGENRSRTQSGAV